MRIRLRKRPLKNFGPKACRCCAHLSWKALKQDLQTYEEAVNDADYTMSRRKNA